MVITGKLRVGVSPWSKLNHSCIPSRAKRCDPGTELEILETVAMALNLTLEFHVTNIRGCGKFGNGTWNGLSGMLLKDEIDITGNLCDFETKGRQADFGFSSPVWQYPNAFLMKAPDFQISFKPTAPFSSLVWKACAILSTIWLLFLILHSKWFSKKPIVNVALRETFKLVQTTFGMRDPKHLEWFWILWLGFQGCMLMLYNNYIIRALMASYPINRPFKNGQEFAQLAAEGQFLLLDYRDPPDVSVCFATMCPNLELAVQRGHYIYSADSSGSALLNKLVSNDKLVLMKGLTFLETYLSDYRDREKLWLFSDDSLSESRSVFLWQKGGKFFYEKEFNRILSKMAEFKLNARMRRVQQTSGQRVRRGDPLLAYVKEERTLVVGDIVGPLLYLLFGIGVSIVAFALEILHYTKASQHFSNVSGAGHYKTVTSIFEKNENFKESTAI